jgi:hypothetical protein
MKTLITGGRASSVEKWLALFRVVGYAGDYY